MFRISRLLTSTPPSVAGRPPSISSSVRSADRDSQRPRTSLDQSDQQNHLPKLEIAIESPPILLYGNAETSSGAMLTGQIKVSAVETNTTFVTFKMVLKVKEVGKRQVYNHCHDCISAATSVLELHDWEFLHGQPLTMSGGDHSFPFSYLVPGNLQASVDGILGSIEYSLEAMATTSTGETLSCTSKLKIERAIVGYEDRVIQCLFPEANTSGLLSVPRYIHPIGDFQVDIKLNGTLTYREGLQYFWGLYKMMWRIEETEKLPSPTCAKHSIKVRNGDKPKMLDDRRTLAMQELRDGWKTDITGQDLQIDLGFTAFINPATHPICDVCTDSEFKIAHNIVLEFILIEQYFPVDNPSRIRTSGTTCVLRRNFRIVVTEHSGLGISWDKEQPPLYGDVPPSPPLYAV